MFPFIRVNLETPAPVALPDLRDPLVMKVVVDPRVNQACQALEDLRVLAVNLVILELLSKANQVNLVTTVNVDLLDQWE